MYLEQGEQGVGVGGLEEVRPRCPQDSHNAGPYSAAEGVFSKCGETSLEGFEQGRM